MMIHEFTPGQAPVAGRTAFGRAGAASKHWASWSCRNGQPEPTASVISFGFLFGICQVLVFEHCRNNTGVEQRLSERPSEQRIAFRA
jgi:hypothetical protein